MESKGSYIPCFIFHPKRRNVSSASTMPGRAGASARDVLLRLPSLHSKTQKYSLSEQDQKAITDSTLICNSYAYF